MKKTVIFLSVLALGFAGFDVAAASFNNDQKTQIETIVHDYLIQHPEILIQMSQELQNQQFQQMQEKALAAIKNDSALLFNPQGTTVAGNPTGKVTLVEFFDYQCVHCSNVQKQKVIANLIAKNPNLRVVYQEFPIFGDVSNYAAHAAMAATEQGKYLEMRNAIFATGKIEGALTKKDIDAAAKNIGLDMKRYQHDMKQNDNVYNDNVKKTYTLAQDIGINGTPAFIIAPTPKTGNADAKTTFVPGLVPQDQLQQAIDAAK